MAIQFLKCGALLASIMLLVGCEKWADGVVSEVAFPQHTPTLAATVNLYAGDTSAVAALYQTSSTLTLGGSTIPAGVTGRIEKDGESLLTWAAGDTAEVGEDWDSRTMHVLALDSPLDLPEGELKLIVEAPGFEPLSAMAVQPPTPSPSIQFTRGADTLIDFGEAVFIDRFELDLENRPGVRDVYGFQLLQGYTYNPGDTTWYVLYLDMEAALDPRVAFNNACNCSLADDQGLDNQSFDDIILEYKRWEGWYEPDEDLPILKLKVMLLDAPLADFYQSLETHWQSEDNPFANPSSIYSNTSTGYGVFGLASQIETLW
ncbi:MAG: DUF4249 domain-containing protein [Flavobacteriales bacterium]|nr:DUF4249 domain-containing protein [Flavobacteriales bacterium]